MSEETVYITREGYENLKFKYDELVSSKRGELAQKIKTAREQGDLSENAAYKSAKDEQGAVEKQISSLEEILRTAEVVEPRESYETVEVGCWVAVSMEGAGCEFRIVGTPEADPSLNKISYQSPLGGALLGKKLGDKVEVATPVGKVLYTVKGIK